MVTKSIIFILCTGFLIAGILICYLINNDKHENINQESNNENTNLNRFIDFVSNNDSIQNRNIIIIYNNFTK